MSYNINTNEGNTFEKEKVMNEKDMKVFDNFLQNKEITEYEALKVIEELFDIPYETLEAMLYEIKGEKMLTFEDFMGS